MAVHLTMFRKKKLFHIAFKRKHLHLMDKLAWISEEMDGYTLKEICTTAWLLRNCNLVNEHVRYRRGSYIIAVICIILRIIGGFRTMSKV